MERTVFSLPVGLHQRVKALSERRGISMAAFVRETLEDALVPKSSLRIGEAQVAYVAVAERPGEEDTMKRLVISLPDELLKRVRTFGAAQGISMAAYIRDALEERTRRERPKPQFGAFASGFTDTARRAGEIQYGPRTWR